MTRDPAAARAAAVADPSPDAPPVTMAVGFAVSVAQFLPTLFAGGGRLATLATETLSLAGGGDVFGWGPDRGCAASRARAQAAASMRS